MSNTLTGLIPEIHKAMDMVSREPVGFIPSVQRDAVAERAAKDQTIRSHVAPAATAQDVTPASTAPDAGDQTIGYVDMTISKVRACPIRWTGEEQLSINGPGPGYNNVRVDQIAQGLRTLVNEIEVDLGNTAYQGASRATGVAGTAPFGSGLDETADLARILDDNGCPPMDRHCVVNSAAVANMRKLTQLTRANEAGNDSTLRRGELLDVHGFSIKQSSGVVLHTAGAGTGYLVDNASGEAIGQVSITTDTGSGTLLIGDIVSAAADTANKYVANATHAANTLTIGAPGLRVAWPDDNAITIGGDYTPNVAFHRSAIALLARMPALPEEGDAADDRLTVVDPFSGLPFEFAVYKQYRRVYFEVALAWGYKAIKADHIAVLMG